MSIEPGHYEAGKFGIRIEHLAFVVKDEKLSKAGKTWYTFHPVTLCPIDPELIDKKLMSGDQIDWLNSLPQAGLPGTQLTAGQSS